MEYLRGHGGKMHGHHQIAKKRVRDLLLSVKCASALGKRMIGKMVFLLTLFDRLGKHYK